MALRHVAVLLAVAVCCSQGFPRPGPAQHGSTNRENPSARQLLYLPERQQYAPNLQYDYSLLDPQFQLPSYNFLNEKQPFPRIQPQIILYHGAAPGQPFLLQPGAPPGNFLLPQPHQPHPGPNVILRDSPQRPVFVAGYPKPAHIPPIEKDAEEVPTNPSKIPPISVASGRNKPEKLETFNEPDIPDIPKKTPTEVDVLEAADRNPYFNIRHNLRPGQRFFILNGQSLFSNYPFLGQNPNINLKYAQAAPVFLPQSNQNGQNFILRNGVTGQIDDIAHPNSGIPSLNNNYQNPGNLVLLNQGDSTIFRGTVPLEVKGTRNNQEKSQLRISDEQNFGLSSLPEDNEAVVIDAKVEDDNGNADSEVISAPENSAEPTIAQAQPGAIALAGTGGTAAAAPRGTAFAGKEGVAVSSPQATAVAGPKKEEPTTSEPKRKINKNNEDEDDEK